MSIRRLGIIYWISVIGFVLTGCENRTISPVPSYPVYLDFNILGEFPHFVPDNGFQTMITTEKRYERDYVGYTGVLTWIDMSGKYNAADLCCPHCLSRDTGVVVNGIFATCPICDEVFDISYGYAFPTKGKTKYPLRKFSAVYRAGVLQVRN